MAYLTKPNSNQSVAMRSLAITKSTNATEVWFTDLKMLVRLQDGREIAVPRLVSKTSRCL